MNPNESVIRSSVTPKTQFSCRGWRYARVKNTRSMWRITVTIIRFADHLWMLLMNQPNEISFVMRATLS